MEVDDISKFQYYSLEKVVRFFLKQGKEGECWDFKQEWHEETEDLLKDIICFSNTAHDENCYLIFGVSDDLQIKGMQKKRKKQADIIDSMSKLSFAGDIYPKFELKSLVLDGVELDVLVIFDVSETPIFLKQPYGKMKQGCIYSRVGDRNTPNQGNADVKDIELLWKKRFGLTKPPLEYIFDRLYNKLEWAEENAIFYNLYRPEYTLELVDELENLDAEFYTYAMSNENSSYKQLDIKYQQTVLQSYQLVLLDGKRLMVPTPEWGYICHDEHGMTPKYCYKYYILGSKRYRLLTFLYDSINSDQNYAFRKLQDIVLFYYSEEERVAFEVYIESNAGVVKDALSKMKRYEYIDTGDKLNTEVFRERLHVGMVLNELLTVWRKNREAK